MVDDVGSVMTKRRSGGKNVEIVQVRVLFHGVGTGLNRLQVDDVDDPASEPANDSGTSSDNQFKVVRFPSAQ
jgi:hypothetical protein